jgi:PHP family Zn ribbon phosphoesterase
MKVIADLEVHSKYARAVSPQMTPENISTWAGKKGIGLVGTGDFTHPMWFRELEANLEEAGDGIFELKSQPEAGRPLDEKVNFLLTSEVS